MAGYVTLFKYTQQGLADIKTLAARLPKTKELIEKNGARLVGIWWTLGEYDGVVIIDAPDEQVVAAIMLANGMRGIVTSQTMRAFSEDEIMKVVARLP